jgi:hypothetical protein
MRLLQLRHGVAGFPVGTRCQASERGAVYRQNEIARLSTTSLLS